MAEVRFYVFLGGPERDVQVSVHRRLETVRSSWDEHARSSYKGSGLVHVGTSAPATIAVQDVLTGHPGRLLVAESARWSLGAGCTDSAQPVSTLPSDRGLQPLPVRLVLSGWGYEIEDFVPEAAGAGSGVQSQADQTRHGYRKRLAEVDADDPHAILHIVPSWFLSVPLESVDLSVRCRNVFRRMTEVQTVGDIVAVPADVMLKWRNFGQRSLKDLADSLRRSVDDPSIVSLYSHDQAHEAPRVDCESDPLVGATSSFEAIVHSVLGGEEDRRWYIFSAYFGRSGPPATLQQIAETVGITRERVRQIKEKALDALRTFGAGEHVLARLQHLLADRSEPLYVDLLEVEDPWFSTSASPEFVARLLHEIAEPHVKRININGRWAVSRLDAFDWGEITQRVTTHAEELAQGNAAERHDVERDVATIARSARAPELAEPLLAEVRDLLHFASVGAQGPEVLVSVGRGLRPAVECVLEGMAAPLHFTAVADLISQQRGEEVAPTTVLRYLNEQALRLGRGTYGLPRHIPLSASERHTITDAAVDAVLEGPAGHQWHVKNLIEEVSGRIDDVPECLDAFVLNALLADAADLRSLGRMVWVAASGSQGASRIDVRDACVAILRRFGRPMTTAELRAEISSARGVNSGILIVPDGRVTRVASGVWGLVDRDILLSDAERDEVAVALMLHFECSPHALHASEVLAALQNLGLSFLGLTGGMVCGLARAHPDLNVALGELVHPAAWATPQRLNVRQSVLQASALVSTPASTEDIREAAERLARRPLTPRDIVAFIRQAGLEYDPVLRSWSRDAALVE